MIVVTSLSPGHKNAENQRAAAESWAKHGECFSLNCDSEIEQLQGAFKDVCFLFTTKTMQHLYGRPLVSINAIIDMARDVRENLLITNSDIIITDLPELKQDGITIFSRYDYKINFSDAERFIFGFDMFYIPKQFLKIFPPSIYALGECWWDLSLPLRAIQKNVPLYSPTTKHGFHKKHTIHWSQSQWERIAEYFIWEFGWDKKMTGGQAATEAMVRIKNKLITV